MWVPARVLRVDVASAFSRHFFTVLFFTDNDISEGLSDASSTRTQRDASAMTNRRTFLTPVQGTTAAAACLLAMSMGARAQEKPKAGAVGTAELQEIVVTGSRIARPDLDRLEPTTIVSSETFDDRTRRGPSELHKALLTYTPWVRSAPWCSSMDAVSCPRTRPASPARRHRPANRSISTPSQQSSLIV